MPSTGPKKDTSGHTRPQLQAIREEDEKGGGTGYRRTGAIRLRRGRIRIRLDVNPETRVHIRAGDQGEVIVTGSPCRSERCVRESEWGRRLLDGLDLSDEEFSELLEEVADRMNFRFSMIILKGVTTFLASDLSRSFPLFYGRDNKRWFVTDNLELYLDEQGQRGFDPLHMEELLTMGNVLGPNTVYRGIRGILPAEVIRLDDGDPCISAYYRHLPHREKLSYESLEEYTSMYDTAMKSIIRRMAARYPSVRNWVVSLSGGHDSRLILNYLYKLDIRNVVCFTYGVPGNEESEVSRQLAEAAGYPWYFVEYTAEKWQDLHRRGTFDDMVRYAFNGTSTPHTQDFLALTELLDRGIISGDDVLLPGFAGDILNGALVELADGSLDTEEKCADEVLDMLLNMKPLSRHPLEKIISLFRRSPAGLPEFREYLYWQERMTKFIVNCLRAYEFLGMRTYLPFLDRELVDLCMAVPIEDRYRRGIFIRAEQAGLLAGPFREIPFAYEKSYDREHPLKTFLKEAVPGRMMSLILRLSRRREQTREGLNSIYLHRAHSIRQLLSPVSDYPGRVRKYFTAYLPRYPYQFDYHILTCLYALRLSMNREEEDT